MRKLFVLVIVLLTGLFLSCSPDIEYRDVYKDSIVAYVGYVGNQKTEISKELFIEKWMKELTGDAIKVMLDRGFGDKTAYSIAQDEKLRKAGFDVVKHNTLFEKYYNDEWGYVDNIRHYMYNLFDVLYQDEIEEE